MLKKLTKVLSMCLAAVILATAAVGCSNKASGKQPDQSGSQNTNNSGFPERAVTLMVPYGGGSSVDINGRAIQMTLQEALGQTVIVENREGGGGAVGFTYLAGQDDSGYMMGIANIASICTNAVLGDLTLNPSSEYRFVGCTATDPFLILVNADSPFNTLQDLIDYALENPGTLTYGATGAMSMDTMSGYDIEVAGSCDLNIVSFASGAEVMAGILGGHVQACGSALSEALPYIQDNSVKCIGIGGNTRSEILPDVPTYDEQGIPMTFQMAKRAIFVPADTNQAAFDVLVSALKEAVNSDTYQETCATLSLQPQYLDPDACMEECVAVMEFLKENKDALGGD